MDKIRQPIPLFKKWFEEEINLTKVQIPTAVCLSTIGIDDFPNARYVSFKEIHDESFIITGPLNSRKGIEIEKNNKVSLTFWWTETERQIRVQGIATKISEELAEKYFHARDFNSKVVSMICEQGKETSTIKLLEQKVLERVTKNKKIDKPKDWGGFSIKPVRIEFMEFRKSRFHDRKLFEFKDEKWILKQLQP
ncbi:pyridoxal 5'-phosphate synthase [Mangrovivirga sp. M17]|uniref:Pyridoxal 5'-phosphate synthase n=1 Tax=Mangrovivirga halotolerans TaxID=2993936 RepID=A0ABT3RPR4_9BACT|nr:pyridoxal 5'-phosphate synthase [Mangrovivirga halotolerans]MCX2743777.1 pyridoxal 5'-phosphate synthase [Mangrovivirga halotolerans]